MKLMLKRALGWAQKSASERAEIVQRFDLPRYRLIYFAACLACFLPIPLRFLLRACLSDKHQVYQHLYGYTYGQLFGRFKYRPIKLLEIGIGGYGRRLGGESLNAWQAYFPFARIVGCDIQPKQQLATFRTKIYQLDQSSREDLEALREREKSFDIIIDDGSHRNAHQIFTFEILFPALKQGGVYVVEDIQTSYWSHGGWDGSSIADPAFAATCVGYFLELAKYVNHSEFADFRGVDPQKLDLAKSIKQIIFECNLIIVLKGDNTRPSNVIGR
jgi:Methyltransferase domain